MGKKNKTKACCGTTDEKIACCKVDAVVSVDERGQMVLPKEIRDKAHIDAGDKLTLVSWEKDGKVCCISLIKADDFAEMVKDMLGPVMQGIVSE